MATMSEQIYRAFRLGEDVCQAQLEAADAAANQLRSLYPLSEDEQLAMESYEADFLVRFTYNSAAIEGSTLSLADTALVLEGEFMPSEPADKRLSDVFAARGIADGVAFARAALADGRQFDEDLIKDIHERTALDCQPRTRGSYRMGAVRIAGSLTITAKASEVRVLMGNLIYALAESTGHPTVRACAFHAMFENIHPFVDGNGRAGRILLNYLLEQEGYPPVALKAANRAAYIQALEDWQVRSNPAAFITLVTDQIVEEAEARYSDVMQSR